MINCDMGTMMKDASKLAARTDVVWEEMTTAPVTITTAWAVVSSTTWIRSDGAGCQPTWRIRPIRYTPMPR